ncbi:tail protein X [Campylobacter majalis]|uniref:tail protein X n=1 Tax=Campylobacter majalis TaxID=2790656 RepID=UPI003D6966E8
MKIYIAKDNETLDQICFKIYGSLKTEIYSEFLRHNETLLNKHTLSGGDEVKCPEIKLKSQLEVKYLWD